MAVLVAWSKGRKEVCVGGRERSNETRVETANVGEGEVWTRKRGGVGPADEKVKNLVLVRSGLDYRAIDSIQSQTRCRKNRLTAVAALSFARAVPSQRSSHD